MENCEIEIKLPVVFKSLNNVENLLIENVFQIEKPTYVQPKPRYKFTVRGSIPPQPKITDLIFTILKNEYDDNNKFVFRCLKDWYDLNWNNETGQLNYVRSLFGEIIINFFTKEGYICEKYICHNSQPIDFEDTEESFKLVFSMEFFETIKGN